MGTGGRRPGAKDPRDSDRCLKVLCIIDHLGPAGSQQQIVTLGRSLQARGHEVEFFVYYPEIDYFKTTLEESGIAVHTSPKAFRLDPAPPVALRRIVHAGRPDVAVSFLTTPNVYNIFASLTSDTRSVVSERSAFTTSRIPISTRLKLATYRFADHIVVNSRHQHRRLCDEFSWMADKSTSIPNGVDLDRFRPDFEAAGQASSGRDAILAVGSVHAGKNYTGLIQALRIYRDRHGEPPLIRWVGREPKLPRDLAAFEKAKQLLVRHGLEGSWEWMGVRSDVPELLNRHDAFIHPSFFEGLPNAVCEALAAGKPVLVSDVCDHPWLAGDGERGFLFNPDDPADIAEAIRRFALLTSAQRREMARKARSFAEKALAVDVFVDAYERLFESIL